MHSESRVSCHYLVDENGGIVQMVDENMRAWHAGISVWNSETDVNSSSVGIEIHNPGHLFGYPEFPKAQMDAVAELGREIAERHAIRPENVLAHSDVAPLRKSDPGEKFNWRMLHEEGVGLWLEPKPVGEGARLKRGSCGREVRELQSLLAEYGYGIEVNGRYDQVTKAVVRAFQRHFRQELVDGEADRSTIDTLIALSDARKP